MGMFDDIRCDVPLPDGKPGNAGFQTKDLECTLDSYVITSASRLIRLSPDDNDPGNGTDVDYDGDLVFYANDGRQFRATFESGCFVGITAVPIWLR